MTDQIPSEGDYVLFRKSSSYDPVRVDLKRCATVSPKLVKFVGMYHPRQCGILEVVASFADEETAKRVQQSIDGVSGEYQRRRRAAEDEKSARLTAAVTAANEQVRKIIAAAQAASS